MAKPNKPDKPGKPSPDLVPADFKIWIGIGEGTQDITLDSPPFLDVQDEVGGYWVPRPSKGKAIKEGWGVGLGPEGEGDDCGTYTIASVEGDSGYEGVILTNELYHHNIPVETYRFNIFHNLSEYWTEDNPRPSKADFWYIGIQWAVGTHWVNIPVPPFQIEGTHYHILEGNTNMDTAWEGEYNETSDTWTVTFDNAGFSLWENTETYDQRNVLWTGQLSFTVGIQRILS